MSVFAKHYSTFSDYLQESLIFWPHGSSDISGSLGPTFLVELHTGFTLPREPRSLNCMTKVRAGLSWENWEWSRTIPQETKKKMKKPPETRYETRENIRRYWFSYSSSRHQRYSFMAYFYKIQSRSRAKALTCKRHPVTMLTKFPLYRKLWRTERIKKFAKTDFSRRTKKELDLENHFGYFVLFFTNLLTCDLDPFRDSFTHRTLTLFFSRSS